MITLECPGAVRRIAWLADGQRPTEVDAIIAKAKSFRTALFDYPRNMGGSKYAMIRAVMIPEMVCPADSDQAAAFRERFPNHKEVHDLMADELAP